MAAKASSKTAKKVAAKKAPAKKKQAAKKKAPAKKPAAKKAATKKAKPSAKAPRFDGNTSIRHCAELLGYSEPTIRKDIENNGAPVVRRAQPGKAAVINIGEYHKFKMSQSLGEGNSLADARLEKQREDVRKHKRENDLAEGKLVPIEQVIFFYNELLVILNNKLDGISGKSAAGDPVLRARFLDETRKARVATFNAVRNFLQQFAGGDTQDSSPTDQGELAMGSGEESTSKGSS